MTSTPLKKRFTFKLAANIWGMLLGLVAMSFVTRALGPENYGRFEFVTSNFKLILDTLTLQVPLAYFNWVSRKGHKESIDVASGVTLGFSLAITGAFALFILFSILGGFSTVLWPGIEPIYLWESLIFTLVVFLYQLLVYLSDGMSLTVGLEKLRLLQNFLKAAALLLLVAFGLMNLHAYFFAQIAVISGTIVLSVLWLSKQGVLSCAVLKFRSWSCDERERFLLFVRYYARPLVVLMFSAFLFLYFDRWFLQLIGGSVEQGYFGLSERLGAVAFVFTSAMTPLLTREFAFAHEEQDKERLVRLFERIRLFLFIAAITSCFLSVQSEAVVKLIGGSKFHGAVIPIAIMGLFPIHQTFGQLSASLLLATGQTGLYTKIAIVSMLCSLPVTYFLLAPNSYLVPGLSLGATGLALKMLIAQFIGTNVQLYFNTRYLGISYLKWFYYQIGMIPMMFGLAYGASFVARGVFSAIYPISVNDITNNVVTVAAAGFLYCLAVAATVYISPGIAGTTRVELFEMLQKPFRSEV